VDVVFIGIYVFVEPYFKTPTSLSYVGFLAVGAFEFVYTRSGIFVYCLVFTCQCVVDSIYGAKCDSLDSLSSQIEFKIYKISSSTSLLHIV